MWQFAKLKIKDKVYYFKSKFDQLFVQRVLYTVTIDFKLADMKLESSEAYLLKLEGKLSWVSKILTFFVNMWF